MKILTNELHQRLLWAPTPDDMVYMLRLQAPWTLTNAAYMATCNTMLLEQGREPIEMTDAQTFLEGLEARGVIQIERSQ